MHHHLTHNADLVILNDSGPALAGYLRSSHVVVLKGSDLTYYASFSSLQMRAGMWDPEFKRSPQGRRYAMQLDRPVMANLRNEIFEQRFAEPLPGFNATMLEQICEHLKNLEGDRNLLLELAAKSRLYAERFLSPQKMAEQLITRLVG